MKLLLVAVLIESTLLWQQLTPISAQPMPLPVMPGEKDELVGLIMDQVSVMIKKHENISRPHSDSQPSNNNNPGPHETIRLTVPQALAIYNNMRKEYGYENEPQFDIAVPRLMPLKDWGLISKRQYGSDNENPLARYILGKISKIMKQQGLSGFSDFQKAKLTVPQTLAVYNEMRKKYNLESDPEFDISVPPQMPFERLGYRRHGSFSKRKFDTARHMPLNDQNGSQNPLVHYILAKISKILKRQGLTGFPDFQKAKLIVPQTLAVYNEMRKKYNLENDPEFDISVPPQMPFERLGYRRHGSFSKRYSEAEGSNECRKTKGGHKYRGRMNVTLSGYPCQRWDSQSPHQHAFTQSSDFPDDSVSDAENYCRNPNRRFTYGVWCYTTTSPYVQWELCGVPLCRKPEPSNYRLFRTWIHPQILGR